jgi:hypothetical protein
MKTYLPSSLVTVLLGVVWANQALAESTAASR